MIEIWFRADRKNSIVSGTRYVYVVKIGTTACKIFIVGRLPGYPGGIDAYSKLGVKT